MQQLLVAERRRRACAVKGVAGRDAQPSASRIGPISDGGLGAAIAPGRIAMVDAGIELTLEGGGGGQPPMLYAKRTGDDGWGWSWRRYFKTQVLVLALYSPVVAYAGCLMRWPEPTLTATLAMCGVFVMAASIWATAPSRQGVKLGQGRA